MTLRRRAFIGCALVLGASFTLIGCKDKSGGEGGGGTAAESRGNVVTGDTIKIGEYGSFTGGTAGFGKATHNGILLALKEVNDAGGINGKKVEIIDEDDQSDATKAQTVVQKLVNQDKVLAIIGEVASSRSLRAAPVCQEAKVPMVSPSSTNPKVTEVGDYIFRVCFTDDFQGVVAAQFAYDQGFRNMAVFTDIKSDYSKAFSQYFTEKFTALGGKIAAEQTYQEGDSDFKAQLTTIKGANPDALMVPGYYTEVGTIAKQAREIGMKTPFVGGDGWDDPALFKGAGTALEGSFLTNHYFNRDLPDERIKSFVDKYKAAYGTYPGALDALAYDAAKILFEAIKNAKTLDGVGVKEALAATKDFPGITGVITIDAKRNARKDALVLQVKGEQYKVFKSYKPEQLGL
jgi:branched-chain amino acid transport system substrate-binding protein